MEVDGEGRPLNLRPESLRAVEGGLGGAAEDAQPEPEDQRAALAHSRHEQFHSQPRSPDNSSGDDEEEIFVAQLRSLIDAELQKSPQIGVKKLVTTLKAQGHDFANAKRVRQALAEVKARQEALNAAAARESLPDSTVPSELQELLHAISKGELDLVDTILAKGTVDLNQQELFSTLGGPILTWPLHLAISTRNELATRLILQYGRAWQSEMADLLNIRIIDPDLQDTDGFTVMIIAADIGWTAVVSQLLRDCRADPDIQNRGGCSALLAAAEEGNLDIVKILVDAGANLELATNDIFMTTPVRTAAQFGRIEVVRFLLERGESTQWFAQIASGRLTIAPPEGLQHHNPPGTIDDVLDDPEIRRLLQSKSVTVLPRQARARVQETQPSVSIGT